MRSITKNGKSEVGQILWDGPKWNIGTNYLGWTKMEYWDELSGTEGVFWIESGEMYI